MPTPDLLTDFRAYLVAQDVVRLPTTTGTPPPLWLEPRDGLKAPGDIGVDVTLAAYLSGGLTSQRFESFLRADTVEIFIRATKAADGHATERALRSAIIDKREWSMSNTLVLESLEYRPMQRLSSDSTGFVFTTEYLFWHHA